MGINGAGHFAWGFTLALVPMWAGLLIGRRQLNVQLYLPFLPFLVGLWSALPYFWLPKDTCDVPGAYALFMAYNQIHCASWATRSLGSLNIVALWCAFHYGLILLRYVYTARRVRSRGWLQ